jgi:hypothetical protein
MVLIVIAPGGEEAPTLYIERRAGTADCFRWVLLSRAACVGRRRGFPPLLSRGRWFEHARPRHGNSKKARGGWSKWKRGALRRLVVSAGG